REAPSIDTFSNSGKGRQSKTERKALSDNSGEERASVPEPLASATRLYGSVPFMALFVSLIGTVVPGSVVAKIDKNLQAGAWRRQPAYGRKKWRRNLARWPRPFERALHFPAYTLASPNTVASLESITARHRRACRFTRRQPSRSTFRRWGFSTIWCFTISISRRTVSTRSCPNSRPVGLGTRIR